MNNNRSIFVLEDSSKSLYGGGQAITFKACSRLYSHFHIVLFDTKKATAFNLKATPFVHQKVGLYTNGTIKKDKWINFSFMMELLIFPFYLVFNFFIISANIAKERRIGRKVVLYACTKKTLIYAWFINFFLGVPYVFHAHSYENGKSSFFFLKRFLYDRASIILCVSKFVQKGLDLKNTLLVFNPIEIPINVYPKKIKTNQKIVVASFASLIPQKGLEYLMQSYEYLSDEWKSKIEIRIYGEGFYRDALQKFGNENVKLFGYCPNPEKVYYEDISITVIPSIILESFGMATIESFRFGIPVIASNQGGLAEIVKSGYNGYLVPPANPKAIADHIMKLASNSSLYYEFSKNAINESHNYHIDLFSSHLYKVFLNVSI